MLDQKPFNMFRSTIYAGIKRIFKGVVLLKLSANHILYTAITFIRILVFAMIREISGGTGGSSHVLPVALPFPFGA